MTPQIYLKYLQSKFSSPAGLSGVAREIEAIATMRAGQGVGELTDPVAVADAIRDIAGADAGQMTSTELRDLGMRRIFVPIVRALVPKHVGERLSALTVGTLPIRATNAFAIRAPAGEPIICLNHGLMMLLSHFAEAMLALPLVARTGGPNAANEFLAAQYLFIVDHFANDGRVTFPVLPVKMSAEHMMMVQVLTISMECFVLMHELAHVELGHLAETLKSALPGHETEPEPVEAIDEFSRSEKQEFEADLLAFRWMSTAHANLSRDRGGLDDAAAGFATWIAENWTVAANFFHAIHVVEVNSAPEARTARTHPSAFLRLLNVAAALRQTVTESELDALTSTLGMMRSTPVLRAHSS